MNKTSGLTNGTYKILNVSTGLVMAVQDASTEPGANIVQWSQTGSPDQLWSFKDIGGGAFNIINVKSNLYLSVRDGSSKPGAVLCQWTYTGNSDQQWRLPAPDGDSGHISNSNTNLAISVQDASPKPGTLIVQWTPDDSPIEQWALTIWRQYPQQYVLTEQILKAAAADRTVMGNLLSNPASFFANAGYPLPNEDFPAFNEFFREQQPKLEAMARGETLQLTGNYACHVCQLSFWAVAAGITAIGAGALVYLVVNSPLVIGVAAAFSVPPIVALSWITGLASLAVFTLDSVLTAVCGWMGACD